MQHTTPESWGPPHRFAAAGAVWLVVFLGVYFSFDLSDAPQNGRFDLLVSLPEVLQQNLPSPELPEEQVHIHTDRMLATLPAEATSEQRVQFLLQQTQGDAAAGRYDVLTAWHAELLGRYQTHPEQLPDSRTPQEAAWDGVVRATLSGSPSGWEYFPQRFRFISVATLILAGAWGLGRGGLFLVRFPVDEGALIRFVLSLGLGLSGVSLFTLLFGLAGILERQWFVGFLSAAFVVGGFVAWRDYRANQRHPASSSSLTPEGSLQPTSPSHSRSGVRRFPFLPALCLLAAVPFLLAMFLGSMLPSIDFDVKEYHLQGPKEFYQQGRITMLPHNVYTSFPFLTEMLSLLGMVVYGDWYWGALAGKLVLMAFAPLTALAILAAGQKWLGPTAGWLAFLIHLSTPWTYRISIIAYAEGGLTFYLFATLLTVMLAIDRHRSGHGELGGSYLVAGLLAGSAMACKYPGVLQVVVPLGVAAVGGAWWGERSSESRRCSPMRVACLFALGTAMTVGPWLLKNLAETGNPVYPLLYSVFGGEDWNAEMNAKWKPAHSPPHHHPADLVSKFVDVTLRSTWLSPLLFGLAPLALCRREYRRRAAWLWLYVGFLFLSWWLLTHRIDRFWIPMIPVISLLAGAGACWTASYVWQTTLTAVLALALTFNLAFVTTGLGGYNEYLVDLAYARIRTGSAIASLNYGQLPADAKVLCVGEAQVFDARFPVVYHTVFDECIFEDWCGVEDWNGPAGERPMRDPAAIRETFQAAGITHVFVNWQEILRYRAPGSYGYTDFVTPDRFQWLQQKGLLGPEEPLLNGLSDFESLSERDQRLIKEWAPDLIVTVGGQRALKTLQLFPVITR